MPTTDAPLIHELLTRETIRVSLPGQTKEAVIERLLGVLAGHPAIADAEAVREAVLRRERVMSTGVGKGLGLPHAKTDAARGTVAAFALTEEPVDFGAIDGEPVRLVFLLVGPARATSAHIKILSRISRLLNRDAFRRRLLAAKDAGEVLALLEEGETKLAFQ